MHLCCAGNLPTENSHLHFYDQPYTYMTAHVVRFHANAGLGWGNYCHATSPTYFWAGCAWLSRLGLAVWARRRASRDLHASLVQPWL
jgi:hypothetical protein